MSDILFPHLVKKGKYPSEYSTQNGQMTPIQNANIVTKWVDKMLGNIFCLGTSINCVNLSTS